MDYLFSKSKNTLNGIRVLIQEERAMLIHAFFDIFSITVSLILGLTTVEWVLIFTTIFLGWSFEAMNSAIERLCNLYTKEHNGDIRKIKDISSAASFFILLIALAITILIWGSKIM